MKEDKRKGNGGARKGAGRPIKEEKIKGRNIYIPLVVADIIRERFSGTTNERLANWIDKLPKNEGKEV